MSTTGKSGGQEYVMHAGHNHRPIVVSASWKKTTTAPHHQLPCLALPMQFFAVTRIHEQTFAATLGSIIVELASGLLEPECCGTFQQFLDVSMAFWVRVKVRVRITCKVMEKFVQDYIINHFLENNFISQSSFLKGVLQRTFLFQLTNDLCRRFSKIVIILFLSKAVFIKRTLLFQYFVLKTEPS